MSFNPDTSKQAQEVIFSRKIKKLPHPSLVFSNNNVLQASSQKHLDVSLDVKLTFDEHLSPFRFAVGTENFAFFIKS